MKLLLFTHKTALHLAIEKGNIEMIQLLLENEKLDVNLLSISYFNIELHFNNLNFHTIHSF